jgi:hypothetical protein
LAEPDNSRLAGDVAHWQLVGHWLESGADLWRDIVPAVRSVIRAQRAKEPGWQPRSLTEFTMAIERARVARVTGLGPNGVSSPYATNARVLGSVAKAASRREIAIEEAASGGSTAGANLSSNDSVTEARVLRVMNELGVTDARRRHPRAEVVEKSLEHRSCTWCGAAFRARGGAGKKRFCSDQCRAAFHRGCRLWARRAVDEGRLSLEAIRSASAEPYTVLLTLSRPAAVEAPSGSS